MAKKKNTTPEAEPQAETADVQPDALPSASPHDPPTFNPPEPSAIPMEPPPLPPSADADLIPLDENGPGLYLCTRTCYGERTYEKGRKYRLEKNICSKHFARIGE